MTVISTFAFLTNSAKELKISGEKGKQGAVMTAAAITWNNHFAVDNGQVKIPARALRDRIIAALENSGSAISSVKSYVSDGQIMARCHEGDLVFTLRAYVNDPARNSAPTLEGAITAVNDWHKVTFPNVKAMKDDLAKEKVDRTEAEKALAKLAKICHTLNACKDVPALRQFAALCNLKADVLATDGNLSAETRGKAHAEIAAIVGSFKPQDEKDQEAEITAGMLEEAEDVAREAAEKQQEAVNTALAMMDHASAEAKRAA